jgi:hypothetical protein
MGVVLSNKSGLTLHLPLQRRGSGALIQIQSFYHFTSAINYFSTIKKDCKTNCSLKIYFIKLIMKSHYFNMIKLYFKFRKARAVN